jgi:hypothetical protein
MFILTLDAQATRFPPSETTGWWLSKEKGPLTKVRTEPATVSMENHFYLKMTDKLSRGQC